MLRAASLGSGGGGTPGGTSGQIQYNNGGSFGGLTIGGDATLNSGTGALTVTRSNGVAFGTLAFANSVAGSALTGTSLASGITSSSLTSFGAAPALGAATGTSLALGGATLGANALAVTGTVALGGATISGSGTGSFLSVSGTWNTSGVVDAALLVNVTNTASGANSLLADFQVGGASKVNITSTGRIFSVDGGFFYASTLTGMYASGATLLFYANGTTALQCDPSQNVYLSQAASWFGISTDTFLTRPAAATWQHGKADAAAPVAQTLQVQSVVAGTSNTSGQNLTVNGSRSTGSGTSGDIVFQTGGTGAGATAQNSLVPALTIKGATQLVYTNSATQILGTKTTITGGPTSNVPTLTSGPVNGNPTKWLPYDDNGTTRYIPAW
jgi:hypothetical protein